MIIILVTLFACSLAADQTIPKIVFMDQNHLKEHQTDFQNFPYKMVLVGKEKYVLTEQYIKQAPLYYNFTPRPDDVFLVYYPAAGTLWFSEVVWLLVNKLNFKAVQSTELTERVFWFEQSLISRTEVKQLPIEQLKSPRILQTNLAFNLIPKIFRSSKKIIFFARNPKDTLVAYYNLFKNRTYYNFVGKIDRFWYYLENNIVLFSPFWSFVKQGFAQRSNNRVLFSYSEEDPLMLVKKLSKFLCKTYTDKQLQEVANFMEKRAKIGKGTWKGVFSNDLNGKMNKWIKENIGDLKFPNVDLYS